MQDATLNVLKLEVSENWVNTYTVFMLKQVVILKEGVGFGEQALDTNKPR